MNDLHRLKGGIEFIDAIPKSQSGKILKTILKERENVSHENGTAAVTNGNH
jgi:acyl-coenzyme A synthetase/AMP-(fatty) acid ligase